MNHSAIALIHPRLTDKIIPLASPKNWQSAVALLRPDGKPTDTPSCRVKQT
jgi:hypothetical protein